MNAARSLAPSTILDDEMVVQDGHDRLDLGALRFAIINHPDRLIFHDLDLSR